MINIKKSWIMTAIIAPVVVGLAGILFQTMLKEKHGELQVSANLEKVDVLLNKVHKGTIPQDRPLVIEKLKPGSYFLICTRDGYEPLYFEDVRVTPGEVTSKLARFNTIDTAMNSNKAIDESYIARRLESERSDIDRFVSDWKSAWEQSAVLDNIDAYRKFYSTSFTSDIEKGAVSKNTYQTWMDDQQNKARRKSWIKVGILGKSIRISGDEAEVTFCQVYQSDDHADKGIKRLVIRREGNALKIVHEYWEKQECS